LVNWKHIDHSNMFTIFGFPINLSNLYASNQMPFDAFGVVDGWPYVHYVMPFFFRLFVSDLAAKLINHIIYRIASLFPTDSHTRKIINWMYVNGLVTAFLFMFFWETGEAIVAGTVRTVAALEPQYFPSDFVNWFGETAFDSQVGDIIQGTIGIIMAEYVYRFKCKFREDVFSTSSYKTTREGWIRFIEYMIIGAFTICTTVFSPLEGVNVEDVFGHTIPFGWTAIPIGFHLYGLTTTIVLLWMYYRDWHSVNMYGKDRIMGIEMAYTCAYVYFAISFVACGLFNIGTYFMLWFITPVIFCVLYTL